MEVQRNTDGDTPSNTTAAICAFVVVVFCMIYEKGKFSHLKAWSNDVKPDFDNFRFCLQSMFTFAYQVKYMIMYKYMIIIM